MDLRNAGKFHRELTFLSEFDAAFLHEIDHEMLAKVVDPFVEFDRTDRRIAEIVGPLLNWMAGGGEYDRDGGGGVLEYLSRMHPEIGSFMPPQPSGLAMNADRRVMQAFFEGAPKMRDEETLRSFLDRQGLDGRTALERFFPDKVFVGVNERANAALMLNFFLTKPAKGIRATDAAASEREVVDAFHIAHGLACDLFLTADQSTHKKFNLLATHWNTRGRSRRVKYENGVAVLEVD